MKHLLFLLFALSLVFAVVSRDARADAAGPTRPTRPVFALIVTSNHGVSGDRPDLHFADDDGVKYLELFRMLAPEANVILHTELDRDTERLYPWARAVARPPTKAAVAASVAELAPRIAAATSGGGAVDFYFVFAGHGDVDQGVGFLELRDARFTSADLEGLLRATNATRSHVILDSCNSFFLVNARKPGGRPVATTADEARTLGERLPSVGVFLSTSAEAEVFEWSELQAGIFSHAVRSGLTGAADADGDGAVSYDELRAFVSVAAARIKNPLYRPKVFARAPGADGRAPLVTLPTARAAALRLDGPELRLTLRDADDVPLVDLHKEAGAVVTLRLPDRWATRAAAEERDPDAQARVLRRLTLDAPRAEPPMLLAELAPAPAAGDARGAGEVFRTLFAAPFGPRAMAQALPEVRIEDKSAVYGVSEDQVERMRVLLAQAAGDGRGRRFTIGAGYVAFGSVLGAAGGWLATKSDTSKEALPYVLLGYGGLLVGLGGASFLMTSPEEDLYASYAAAMGSTVDPARRAMALAAAETELFALRRRAATKRTWLRVTSLVLAGAAAGLFAANELDAARTDQTCVAIAGATSCTATPSMSADRAWAGRLTYGSLFALGATAAVSSFVPYPVERLAQVWESDPGRVHGQAPLPSVGFAPMPGGGTFTLRVDF